jgi:hypothetical protein
MHRAPIAPLILAKLFGIPQDEVAFRLRMSADHLRRIARDPRQAQRVRIAELEAILDAMLEQERAKDVAVTADEP